MVPLAFPLPQPAIDGVLAEIGKVPALAFEVVSDEYEKDYDPRLLAETPDHVNAESWRQGLIPNTAIRR